MKICRLLRQAAIKQNELLYENSLKLRNKYMHSVPSLYYTNPVMHVKGHMQWIWDHQGKKYLDMWGGIVTVGVGHSHPKVNEAVKKQIDKIQHTTLKYLHPLQGEYAEAIVKHMPSDDWVVFFTNSGSESNDLATLIARCHTKSFEYITVRNGYHGMTEGSRALTSARGWKWQPPSLGIRQILHPSKYRGVFGDKEDAVDRYIDDLKCQLEETCSPRIAGFIAEPIQGVGGVYEMPSQYLSKAYKIIRDHGGVCTSDEVQTGWGRLGTHFWGFQWADCEPDIIVVAKSMGNGFPIGGVIVKRKIAEAMTGAMHFNTYGGNPVCLAAGLATLRVIEEENLQENSRLRGYELLEGFNYLSKKHSIIGDIRGQGLMTALEFVKDRNTKEPAINETIKLQELMKDEGIIVGNAGTYGNVLRFVPPMCIEASDIEFFIDRLDRCLSML